MRGFWQHVRMSLVLNTRNRQALIFGYVVPVFFLIAFVAIFGGGGKPDQMATTIAPLIVISVMGGACFGMPITLVNERDRGVWRRYRLTPLGSGTFITSTIVSRLVLVTSSAALQIALAMWIYGLGWPKQPLMFLAAFLLVSVAFIGIGLIIAAVANSIGAVQALGQSLFLPMIMIGGVGVPLLMLPEWAREFSRFLPGRYAMELIQRAYAVDKGFDLEWERFKWRALVILLIGLSATLAGWKLFRWESDQRLPRTRWLWVGLALATWVAAGVLSKLVKLE